MGLIGMLVREVITLVSEFKSKKKLENQLGRKVETRDIYSLGVNLEAAEASPPPPNGQSQFAPPNAPPLQPAGTPAKSKGKLLIFGFLGCGTLLILGLGVVGLFVMTMSEDTYNRLNPFTPKTPVAAFPPAIGDYKVSTAPHYDRTFSDICKCNYFYGSYLKGNNYVSYKVYEFKTEADAKSYLNGKSFIGGGPRMEQVSDSRFVAISKDRGDATIAETLGKDLIVIAANNPADAIGFENALPYSAFGVQPPPVRVADGLADDAMQITTLIEEYKRDKKAAQTKYEGKTLLLTGSVVVVNTDTKDKPYLAFQIPGSKPTIDSMVICSFTPGEISKVAATKTGTYVRFRGKVNMNTELLDIMTVDDCKFEPTK
jgi:hypothetical protein